MILLSRSFQVALEDKRQPLTEAEKKHTVLGTEGKARLGENEAEVKSPEVDKREADNDKADDKSLMVGEESEKEAGIGDKAIKHMANNISKNNNRVKRI